MLFANRQWQLKVGMSDEMASEEGASAVDISAAGGGARHEGTSPFPRDASVAAGCYEDMWALEVTIEAQLDAAKLTNPTWSGMVKRGVLTYRGLQFVKRTV